VNTITVAVLWLVGIVLVAYSGIDTPDRLSPVIIGGTLWSLGYTYFWICKRRGLRSPMASGRAHQGRMHVRRAKNGTPSVHPIRGDEIRAFKLRRENPSEAYVFVMERGGPMKHHRLSPSRPEARRGRQDASPTASSHAAACVRL
jgi:hypothetical protein